MQIELTRDHLPLLTDLVNAIEVHDEAPFRTLPSELEEYFEPGDEIRSLGIMHGERLCAFGVVRLPSDGGNLRFSGGVHPDHRGEGYGGLLMEWSETAAQDLAAERRDAVLEVHVEEGRNELGDLLEAMGFEPTHGFVSLRRDLSEDLEPVEIPAFFHVIPWNDLEQSLAESYEEMIESAGMSIDPMFFMPEWSFVIVDKTTDRTTLAGYVLCNKYAQDWDVTGWTEGFTETVVVQPEYRGSHLASRLLLEAAQAFRRDGMQYAGIEVDVDRDGQSPVMALFTSLDYVPVRRTYTYTRRVFPLKPIVKILGSKRPVWPTGRSPQ